MILTRPICNFRWTRKVLTQAIVLAFAASTSMYAQSSACDLDSSGSVNVVDVTSAVNMALGVSTCTANVEGPLTCTVVTVQRVVNAALGQTCVTYNSSTHTVTVNWTASTSAGVVGYNIYRKLSTASSFTKINTSVVTGLTFTDSSVQLGQTYYYVVTSVDASGNESAYSNQATAVIPAT